MSDLLGAIMVEAGKQPSALFANKDVEGLMAFLDDPTTQKESEAAWYLLLLGVSTKETLDWGLSHGDKNTRLAAAWTYAKLAWERNNLPPQQKLDVNDVQWEEEARRVVEPLTQALGDRTNDYRKMTATALGWTRDVHAVEPLIQALSEGRMDIRNAAAGALVTIGDMAVDPVIGALKHGMWIVRERAAWVLALIGNTKAVEPLILALKDEDNDVHLMVQEALEEMADKSAEAELAFRDDQLAFKCWYCEQHSADPLALVETKMNRGQASVIVRVQRCSRCEVIHRRGTKTSTLFGALILIACPVSYLLANQIYANATGRSSWIPGIVVGLIVSAVAIGIYFELFLRLHQGGVKGELVYKSQFPKIQEMIKEGWKVQVAQ